MVRVKGQHWTADFTIARALSEAYRASGKDEIVYLCVGDPEGVATALGPRVGKELLSYYPYVVGTTEQPVRVAELPAALRRLEEQWPNAFVIGIEAVGGAADDIGFIEVTDRGLPHSAGDGAPWVGDVGVLATLWTGPPPQQLEPVEYNRMLRITDAIVDGQIRFLQRVKKYLPEL